MPLNSEYGKISDRGKSLIPLLRRTLERGSEGKPMNIYVLVFAVLHPDRLLKTIGGDREPPGSPQIRAMILYMRLQGEPVASSKHGYWIARNQEELQPTIDEFRLIAKKKSIVANQLDRAFDSSGQTEMGL